MRSVYKYLINAALISVLLTGVNNLQAQNGYGDKWIFGISPSLIKADATRGDFMNTPIDSAPAMNTSGCISDINGNLLFYTNGRKIFNMENKLMKNGDSLNVNTTDTIYWKMFEDGIDFPLSAIILPLPGSSSQYCIFHTFPFDTFVYPRSHKGFKAANRLRLSIVDMQGDKGKGEVISKNEVVLDHTLLASWAIAACKHANGRDWWLIVPGRADTNFYYKFLITDRGWEEYPVQSIGANLYNQFAGHSLANTQCKFSEDGRRFAIISNVSYATVMDFDRCTGEFSNPRIINNLFSATYTVSGGRDVVFSPSGQFLYIISRYIINQYDLNNINAVPINVYTNVDTFSPMSPEFFNAQIAPNGKIYIANYSSNTPAIHVIHNPDRLGALCNFIPFGQPINFSPFIQSALPNMPNYRLGKLVGSPCDTLVSVGIPQLSKQEGFTARFAPNPAQGFTTLLYQIEEGSTATLALYNHLGQTCLQLTLSGNTTQIDVPIGNLMQGIYFYKVTNHLGEVISGKLEIFK